MVLTAHNLVGFETGGNDEASGSAGTPNVQATTILTGNFSLEMDALADQYDIRWAYSASGAPTAIVDVGTEAGQMGVAFQIADATPAADIALFEIFDSALGATPNLRVSLLSTGVLRIENVVTGATFDGSTVLQDGVRHYIEVLYTFDDTTGVIRLDLDGVNQVDETGLDTEDTGTFTGLLRLLGNATATVFFDDVYLDTGAAVDGSDLFGDFEVFMYQSAHSTNQDINGALTTGTWDLAGETPLDETSGNEVAIEDVALREAETDFDDGPRAGPSGDSRIDGDANIFGAKYYWRFRRTSGASKVFRGFGGNNVDGSTDLGSMVLTTGYELRAFIRDAGTIVPTSSEFFQAGFQRSGSNGRDIFCGEMWANIGHRPEGGLDQPFQHEAPAIHRDLVVRAY